LLFKKEESKERKEEECAEVIQVKLYE